MGTHEATDWHEQFFPGLYGKVLAAHGDDKAANEATQIRGLMQLRRGMSVLDCPCGLGRISRGLASLGLHVTGVDFVAKYLRAARARTAKAGLDVTYVRADMRDLTFDGQFDAVVNWFTSYGYFSEDENRRQLTGFYRALRPGGQLLVEVLNRSYILGERFRPRDETDIGGVHITTTARWDESAKRMHNVWTLDDGKTHEEHHMTLRVFNGTELRRELASAGFVDISLYSREPGKTFTRHSKRLVAIARRPRRDRQSCPH